MNVLTALYATAFTAALTIGAVTCAPEAIAQIHARTQVQGLAAETSTLGQALATDPDGMPHTLTCVPDAADPAGRPCVSFADYDGLVPSGEFAYVLEPTAGGMRLHGWAASGTHVVWDSQTGGLSAAAR